MASDRFYTLNYDEPELLDAEVDGIITNHPGRLQGYLAGRFDPLR